MFYLFIILLIVAVTFSIIGLVFCVGVYFCKEKWLVSVATVSWIVSIFSLLLGIGVGIYCCLA